MQMEENKMAGLSKIEVICDMSKFAAIKKELSDLYIEDYWGFVS